MAISTNTKWAYGSAITPEAMNNIERTIENSIMGAIAKTTEFEKDGSIIEYFGPEIIINDVKYRNKKITTFSEDGSIQEVYDFYYNYNGDNTKGYQIEIQKEILFNDEDGTIEEKIISRTEKEV